MSGQVIRRCNKALVMASVSISALAVSAWADDTVGDDFTSMSLEDLMNVEVTTVSKRKEAASEAAAAVFVLTRTDIERSGATTVPDALRLVPGVNVAQINANSWAVTVRGFNSRFANKLLVMIDGRTVFTPLFSGVNWDKQNLILEDIERIEVVRGPGGTLWGANAVNGVINIITRSSDDTQGTLIKASAGDDLAGQLILRHGGDLNETATYRVHAKYEKYDDREIASGVNANDGWSIFTAGFRTDHKPSETDKFMFSGDFTMVDAGETLDVPLLVPPFLERRDAEIERTNAHILTHWARDLGNESEVSVQAYVDYSDIEIPQGTEERTTVDLQVQHSMPVGEMHHLLWGAGYRYINDDITNSEFVQFDPTSRTDEIFNAFVQDTIELTEDVAVTIGSKFSHNDYTGFEVQPSIRFTWLVAEGKTIWGAISRAVRTPSRAEDNVRVNSQVVPPGVPGVNPGPLPLVFRFTGDPTIESETLVAYEIGTRLRLRENFSIDVAAFLNQYEDLRGSVIGAPTIDTTVVPVAVLPLTVDELVNADTHGVEVVVDWQVQDRWRLQGTMSYLEIDGDLPTAPNVLVSEPGGGDAAHTMTLRSLYDVTDSLRFDTAVRHSDDLDGFGIGGYTAVDARVEYRLTSQTSLAVTGRNLTDNSNFEFGVDPSFATIPTGVERSFHVSITKKY